MEEVKIQIKHLFHVIHNERIEIISFLLTSLSKPYNKHTIINTKCKILLFVKEISNIRLRESS